MNGHIEEVGGSFAVVINGETVSLWPDRESAEKCLVRIYLFHKQKDSGEAYEQ